MEDTRRWSAVAAVAPVAWGATYYVTAHALPEDAPLWGSALRALPAGLVLLALARRLPRGRWWWRSLVLGVLGMSGFFVLVYVAAQRLPTSVAATVMATSPFVLALVAWPVLGQRPRSAAMAGAGIGLFGVAAMLATGEGGIDALGVLAGVAAMAMSAVGSVLATRWRDGVDVLSVTAWQLVAGGLVLVPLAVLGEGAPPALDATGWLAIGYASLIATALAYLAWFAALRRLPADAVGVLGLLNPVTGVVLGVALGGERLTGLQGAGLVAVLAGVLIGQPGTVRALRRRRPGLRARPAPPSVRSREVRDGEVDGVRVAIRVRPGASRTRVGGDHGGRLVVAVGARAVDGAATEAALTALADALGLRRREVALVTGATSRDKVVEVDAADEAAVAARVAELRAG